MSVCLLRRTAARLGQTGDLLAVALTSLAAAALVVAVKPDVSNLAVGIAAFVGMFAGDIGWSWVRSRPMFWRRPAYEMRTRTKVLGYLLTALTAWAVLELVPIKRFVGWRPDGQARYVDYPGTLLLLIAGTWLVVLMLDVVGRLVAGRVARDINQR